MPAKNYLLNVLYGDAINSDLKKRVFISATIITLLGALIGLFWNIYIGLPFVLNVSLGISVLMYFLLFYYSRFKNKYSSAIFIIGSIIGLSVFYIGNGGINGPIPSLFLAFLLVFISITKQKYHRLILFVTLFDLGALILLEHTYFHDLVIHYDDNETRIMDLSFGYLVLLFLSYLIMTSYKNSIFTKNQELISAKEKAEESDRLKTAFLANMSHEIRTPMNGILGFTQMLQEADLSDEHKSEYIGIIRKSGNRLLNTVNDIIEISKIESGEIHVNMTEVNVVNHLKTLIKFFKPEASKKNIDIDFESNLGDEENKFTVVTDKNKLSSILSNLIKNAIKYTEKGFINVSLNITTDKIFFACKDSGVGIPKNRQKAIFNRFEQADIEDKLVKEGSGLGLAITKSYVEMLGGNIWVESEEGQGAVFYVSLPYVAVEKRNKKLRHKQDGIAFKAKNINVLIVEDDKVSQKHLIEILEGKVKSITVVENGVEAIDACKSGTGFDLILMDTKMPKLNGHSATKTIREINKDVVIIAQTAFAFEEDKQKAISVGCNDFISKPIDMNVLYQMIDKYF